MRLFEFIDHFGERGFHDLNAYDLQLKFQSLQLPPDLQGELTRDDAPTLALFAWLYLTGKTLNSRRLDHNSLHIDVHTNVSGVNVVTWLTEAFLDYPKSTTSWSTCLDFLAYILAYKTKKSRKHWAYGTFLRSGRDSNSRPPA